MPELPMLSVFFGLSGSGKSYFGRRWADKSGCHYFNSDTVRKELAGLSPESRQWVDIDTGIYGPDFSRKTYDRLIYLAETEISKKKSCVLDATYISQYERELVVEKFAGLARILFVMCTCSDDVAMERFRTRAADAQAVSDGRWSVYLEQKKKFTPPTAIKGAELYVFNTENDIAQLLLALERKISGCKEDK